MRRIPLAAIAIALALAGCPLPQPLPTYPAGTVTPPRILTAKASGSVNSLLLVPANCATAPAYDLEASIFYQESVTVVARWFVDYRTDVATRYAVQNASNQDVPPGPDALVLERAVPPFRFSPYEFPPAGDLGIPAGTPPYPGAGIVHVVELVVSNGFASPPDDDQQKNRTPAATPDGTSQFEIQTFRWVFVSVPEDATATCAPGSIGCPRCPTP